MGSGKTLSMVKRAYEYHLQGYSILSNMKLTFPHVKINNRYLQEFAKNKKQIYNSVILIDEFHTFMDSRRSIKARNLLGSYFITQTRKQKVKLLGTTQHRHQIDRRVRDNTTMFIDCEKIELPVTYKDNKLLLMTNHINTRDRYEKVVFIGNDFFELYDTEETIYEEDDD
jgi:archaellum biogenesis ATPase FlaH